ncbi:MAG: FAD-dependent oxidoreductase [Clostridia bacterium]|nr:FAD-dependent oxidoreductase [Clostridia bacterium]
MYDIVIIGAGPAGLTAALYALRAEKSVLVIEKGVFGGQITFSPKIENYPGFTALSGNELADKMMEQVIAHGAEFEMAAVTGIADENGVKKVFTDEGTFEGKTVIIATGAAHRHLGAPGEEELIGSGISFCAVCDGAFYSGQTVAVIGGGNSALQEAALLSETCKKVIIVQNLPALTGEKRLADALLAKDNVEAVYNSTVSGFESANGAVTGVKIHNSATGEDSTIAAEGVFVAIGLVPATDFLKDTGLLDEYGYVKADESCRTAMEGVFVAGDCRTKAVRQITTAAADGATAALAACSV